MKNKDIFLKTKKKIVNTSLSILIIGVVIFSIIIFSFYYINTFRNIDIELHAHITKVTTQLTNLDKNFKNNDTDFRNPNNDFRNLDTDFRNLNSTFRKSMFSMNPKVSTLIYFDNELVEDTPNTYYLEHDFTTPFNIKPNKIMSIDIDSHRFRIISINPIESLTVQVFMNIESELQGLDLFINIMIVSFIFIILICYLLSLYLSSSVVKPIKKSYDNQLQFIQDASHEMRTPLAIIKGKIEILSSKADDKIDDHFEEISSIVSELRGLEKLNRNLLQLSKEDVIVEINSEEININNFINDICDFYTMFAESQDKEFILNLLQEDIIVNWDKAKMQQALIILLENAFKYSNEGDKIILSLFNNKNKIIIEVSDTGIGINEKDLPKIFDRFYRSDTVRGNNIAGSGIGLSLLKSLSNILEFDIDVLSTVNEGTRFILTIPSKM